MRDWLAKNEAIAVSWPGDVIYARVSEILSDNQVTEAERLHLTEMLQMLIGGEADDLAEASHVSELALDLSASVHIPETTFCLTGDFVFATRSHCQATIVKRGGLVWAAS